MIIIHSNRKNKSISKKIYTDIVNVDVLRKLFKGTEFEDFTVHCYYDRYVYDCDLNRISIRILRIKCNGRTHAILLDSMLPYLSQSYDDVYDLFFDRTSPSVVLFSEYLARSVRKTVSALTGIFSYVSLCHLFARGNCVSFINPATCIDF